MTLFTVVHEDGSISLSVLDTYHDWRAAVGGLIQYVLVDEHISFCVNEEGLGVLPVNVPASMYLRSVVCGPVIIVSNRTDHEGNTLPPDDPDHYALLLLLAHRWSDVTHRGGLGGQQITVDLPTVDLSTTNNDAIVQILTWE